MKGSDSVNSLTELTGGHQDGNTCFICLEEASLGLPLVDSKLLRNCGCTFHVHAECWNIWIKNKTDFDCPICHRASMLKIHIPPNPVIAFQEQLPSERNYKRYIWSFLIFIFVITASSIIVQKLTE